MRITGGQYKGRIVKMPRGILRPAMDRMRESMFAILGNLDGYSFLDLFAGSGIIALEACSRYAKVAHLVEMDTIKKGTILENLKIASNNETKLFITKSESFIKNAPMCYDYIHLDPPFPLHNKSRYLELIDKYNILNKDGTVTIHYPSEEKISANIGDLTKYDERKYGRSILAFYNN